MDLMFKISDELKQMSKKKQLKGYSYSIVSCDGLFSFLGSINIAPNLYFYEKKDLIISNSEFDKLTTRQKRACILHEIGHRELKHYYRKNRAISEEIEADNFAKSYGYGEDLIEVLTLSFEKLKAKKENTKNLLERIRALC